MSIKYPYRGYIDRTIPAAANYHNVTTGYQHFPTEKQMKYLDILKKTCEEEGIDLTNFHLRTKTKSGVKSSIRALQTLLKKNGYYERREKQEAANE